MRSLVYTNPNGSTITLGAPPHVITSLEGIGTPDWDALEVKAPYQDGATDIGGTFQMRDITIEGALTPQSMTEIAAARRLMVQVLNPKDGAGTLDYTNELGTWRITAKPVSSPTFSSKESTDPYQRFQIVFHASDPCWTDVSDTVRTLTEAGAGLAIPGPGLGIPVDGIAVEFVATINGKSIVINNIGDVPCPVLIRFYGEAVNPKVLNGTTGEYIRINKTIKLGDYVEVNTAFGAKTVVISESGVISNGSAYLDLQSTFFQLVVGNNQLKFSDDGVAAGSSATITYRNRYIGV